MGISSCIDHRHRLAFPDTPPELVSPGTSSFPARQYRDRPWDAVVPPISPPMSNYDPTTRAEMASAKSSDELLTPRDAAPTAPRQQLPPLSSLFGPPPPVRPLHSPLSDRPGSHTSTSPHERMFSVDRSFSSSSYFPSTASSSISQPRSAFEPRFEDRTIGSLSRAFPGPLSPGVRGADHQRHETQSEYNHSSKWSVHQESSRNEYSLASREPLQYKSTLERLHPLTGRKRDEDGIMGYREQRTPQSANLHIASTPSSTVTIMQEGVAVKDGLGPKIWTGTHFLPRFVRAAEVPGEGMCYFYDDGSHCKTVIDGEAVNAHWGVTKAGKPRKRLAIACVTCREKKIKCDPDYPRCVQCEKFGRVCKFKNAPRGGHNTSPSTPPADMDESRQLAPLMRPPPDHPRPDSHSSESVSPRTTIRPASPEPAEHHPKRIRIGYEHFTPTGGAPRSPMLPTPAAARNAVPWGQQHLELPRIHEDVLCRVWQTDPYVSDPQSVLNTISSFFVHIDATAIRFLPQKVFTEFLQSSAHKKSPEDLMLVYSILALGISLSGGGSFKATAHEYAEVARYASQRALLSLQLVQARILLALYYLQISRTSDANDMISAAISAAASLQLHIEFGESQHDGSETNYPFDMSVAAFAECRRRTFWSCFILERLSGLFPMRVGIINSDDIFIRVPTTVENFERQSEVMAPKFHPDVDLPPRGTLSGVVGMMGFLVQIVDLWGKVMATVYRTAHRPADDSAALKFREDMTQRLDAWKMSLPEYLPAHSNFSTSALTQLPKEERGAYVLMYLVYHLTMTKLNRHVYPRWHQDAQPSQHTYSLAAQTHARCLIDVICSLAVERTTGPTLLSPFLGYAAVEAIDILSAEGPISTLPKLVDSLAIARSVIVVLATTWDSATAHQIVFDERLDKLAALRERGSDASSALASSSPIPGVRIFLNREEDKEKKLPAGVCWQMADALETGFRKDVDSVYTSLEPLPVYSN